MQAVIPIAGKGTRMAGAHNGPKQLIPVCGKPVIEHVLNHLPKDIEELILIVGGPYKKAIRDYFGTKHGRFDISYVEQKEQRGVGHALQQAHGSTRGKFLVFFPDDIYGKDDLKKLLEVSDLGMLVQQVENPSSFGVVVTDKDGNIVRTVEKPKKFISNLVSTGATILDEEFFDITVPPSARGEIELPDIITKLIGERGRKIKTIEATLWLPINCPEQLSEAEKRLVVEV